MKTVTDIASFLKRNGTKLTLSYDEKSNTFLAWTPGDECASRYLDDALDNLQEAFRRRANAMTPVQEAKAEPAVKQATVATTVNPSPGTAAVCSKCGGRGYQIHGAGGVQYMTYCPCMIPSWMTP